MKYCNKCKRLHNDEDAACKSCNGKSKLITIEDENTPVYLLSAAGFELQRVKSALEDSGIPNTSAVQKNNCSAEASTGFDTSEYDLLVPYSAYEKAFDVCVGIGAIKIGEEEIVDDGSAPTNADVTPLDEQFEKMSGVKRTTVRVVSALLFLGLVALAVLGTDFIMNLLKGLF